MTAASVEFPSLAELLSRRNSLLQEAGLTYEELLDGEYHRSLSMEQYIILDRIRGIDYLLED